MLTLLESSLQIHLLLPLFSLVEALLRRFFQVRQGVSVHYTHVVNTGSPLLTEFPDYKVALLLRDLWRCWLVGFGLVDLSGMGFVLLTARPD